MTLADAIYEQAKTLPEPLAREVLDFVGFLGERAERGSWRDLMDAREQALATVWDNDADLGRRLSAASWCSCRSLSAISPLRNGGPCSRGGPRPVRRFICLPVTSRPHHADGVTISAVDLVAGSLPTASWIRTDRVVTLNASLVLKAVARVRRLSSMPPFGYSANALADSDR